MQFQLGAQLAEASNLLLGVDRKISKIQDEPKSLPVENPVPAAFVGLGEVTRVRKTVQFRDAGEQYAKARMDSEWYPNIGSPVCDLREVPGLLNDPSRLIGRGPTPVKK